MPRRTLSMTLLALASAGMAASSNLCAQEENQRGDGVEATSWGTLLDKGRSLMDEAPDNLELSVAGGLHYEDNLVVESIDVVSAEKDVAAVGELDLDYRDDVWNGSQLRTGYSFSQRAFLEEDDFNLQLHYGFLDLSRELSEVTAGAVVDVTYARVGGDALLNKQKISGYLSDLATENLYWRSSLGLEQTDFDRDSGRSNNGQRVDVSGFYFMDGTRQYVTLGYRYAQEQADSSIFDHYGNRLKLGYVKRLNVADDRPVTVRVDWRFEHRRYNEFDPVIDGKRRDYRRRWRVRMETPVSDALTLRLKYEHRNYSSNNDALDFNDNRIEALLELQLL